MSDILARIPADIPAMGNIDPAGQFRGGTPDSVRQDTLRLLARCGKHPNFIISSGCDIPPLTPWENIDAFFCAVREHYAAE
jgi:uroporphyrinogen decarboxylase